MQCQCKCNCPDGSGECDCDCNCPMTSKAVTCAEGFSKVCPMMEGKCPADMDMMCPNGAMTRMAGGNGGEGSDKGKDQDKLACYMYLLIQDASVFQTS